MTSVLGYLAARMREPSTWAGLAAMFASVGLMDVARVVEAWTPVLATVAGAVAVLLPSRGRD